MRIVEQTYVYVCVYLCVCVFEARKRKESEETGCAHTLSHMISHSQMVHALSVEHSFKR